MKMLDAIKEGFNHVAGAIQRAAVAALGDPMRTWRNDGFCSRGANGLHKGVGVVALVSDDRLRAQVFNQFSRAPGGAATGHLAAHGKGCHGRADRDDGSGEFGQGRQDHSGAHADSAMTKAASAEHLLMLIWEVVDDEI